QLAIPQIRDALIAAEIPVQPPADQRDRGAIPDGDIGYKTILPLIDYRVSHATAPRARSRRRRWRWSWRRGWRWRRYWRWRRRWRGRRVLSPAAQREENGNKLVMLGGVHRLPVVVEDTARIAGVWIPRPESPIDAVRASPQITDQRVQPLLIRRALQLRAELP